MNNKTIVLNSKVTVNSMSAFKEKYFPNTDTQSKAIAKNPQVIGKIMAMNNLNAHFACLHNKQV